MASAKYIVVFKLNEEEENYGQVKILEEKPISLKTLYEIINTDIVERIKVNDQISIYCDEEAKLKNQNFVTGLLIAGKPLAIVGNFCFVAEEKNNEGSYDIIPLTSEQVEWITKNVSYIKESETI